jgi:hypothetical protein
MRAFAWVVPMGAILALGCLGHAPITVSNAALNTAVGLAAGGAIRAGGGCWAACPVGTACNGTTGLCDELPCRGACAIGEWCDKSQGIGGLCVIGSDPTLDVALRGATPAPLTPAQ